MLDEGNSKAFIRSTLFNHRPADKVTCMTSGEFALLIVSFWTCEMDVRICSSMLGAYIQMEDKDE
jgi:hypothetical protein